MAHHLGKLIAGVDIVADTLFGGPFVIRSNSSLHGSYHVLCGNRDIMPLFADRRQQVVALDANAACPEGEYDVDQKKLCHRARI